jgi:cell pole-organizing protein PopZ
MAEKNTHSILETIKNKLNKLDQKTSNLSEVASEFEYIATAKPAQTEKTQEVKNENAVLKQTAPVNNQEVQEAETHVEEDNQVVAESEEVEEDLAEQPNVVNQKLPIQEQAPQVQANQSSTVSEVEDYGVDEEDIEDFEDEVDFAEDHDNQVQNLDDNSLNEDLNLDNSTDVGLAEDELDIPDLESSVPQVDNLVDQDLKFIDEHDIEDQLGLNKNIAEDFVQAPEEIHEESKHQEAEIKEVVNPVKQKQVENIPSQNANMNNENDYDSELAALERELEEQERKRKGELLEQQQVAITPEPIKVEKEEDIELELEKELMGFNPQNIAPRQQYSAPSVEPKKAKEVEIPLVEPQVIKDQEVLEDISLQNTKEEEFLDDELEKLETGDIVKLENQKRSKQILNEETIMQATESIRKLVDAKNVVSGISNFAQSPALKDLATNMLEPRLERWLNENLAPMVEEIVREEIKKILPKE